MTETTIFLMGDSLIEDYGEESLPLCGWGTYFPIQAVEAIFNLLIMSVLLVYIKKKGTKYSIIHLYLIMYSCLRFVLEFFRGDIIRGRFLFFSTSQWVSLIIFFICLFLLRKNIEKNKNV